MCLVMAVVIAGSSYLGDELSAKQLPLVKNKLTDKEKEYDQLLKVSQAQERNLNKYRERQNDYKRHFANSLGGVRFVLDAFKTNKKIEEFIAFVSPIEVSEEQYVLPYR